MCTTCGCGNGQTHINGKPVSTHHRANQSLRFRQPAHHSHDTNTIDFGNGVAGVHAPGISPSRMVKIERDILTSNNRVAQQNRNHLLRHGIFALNLVSSPGSGKTTLLINTIERLRSRLPIAVIEGDQQTDRDAARIRATGVPALQINTGKGCHLDASMIERALQQMPLQPNSLLLIENVGNLVCPSGFDLGEAHKVVILSVTEGEDKPLKYPDMFHAADMMLLNKCDLLPYVDFDVDLAIDYAHRVHPGLPVMRLSATQGSGMQAWCDWVMANRSPAGPDHRPAETQSSLG